MLLRSRNEWVQRVTVETKQSSKFEIRFLGDDPKMFLDLALKNYWSSTVFYLFTSIILFYSILVVFLVFSYIRVIISVVLSCSIKIKN